MTDTNTTVRGTDYDSRLREAIERDPETADRETLLDDRKILLVEKWRREDEEAAERAELEAATQSRRAAVRISEDELGRELARETGLSETHFAALSDGSVTRELDSMDPDRTRAIYERASGRIAERLRSSPDVSTSIADDRAGSTPGRAASGRSETDALDDRAAGALGAQGSRDVGEFDLSPAEYVEEVFDLDPSDHSEFSLRTAIAEASENPETRNRRAELRGREKAKQARALGREAADRIGARRNRETAAGLAGSNEYADPDELARAALAGADTRAINERENGSAAEFVSEVYGVDPADLGDEYVLRSAISDASGDRADERRRVYKKETRERKRAALRARLTGDENTDVAELSDFGGVDAKDDR